MMTIECPACRGHGKVWHTPYPSGWTYMHDFDPVAAWPGRVNDEWRKEFAAKLVSKACEPCDGKGNKPND